MGYDLRVHEEQHDDVAWGYLRCAGCAVVIPIAEGFALFTEPLLHAGQASHELLQLKAASWFGTDEQYRNYMQQKATRGELEPYAAFHPFNESTRAFEAVAPLFAANLQDGDFILDPWSRTGWSAEWLAARFPKQRIIALWEGDRSVLGYRGFRHWLSGGVKAPNLDVLFAHPERGLPLRNNCVAGLYALDSFHRFSLHGFAGECLRVTGKTAPLALAHTHLTNSEPDPWFDRGCNMHHGKDYRAWLDMLLKRDPRRAFVWSEVDLFQHDGGPLPPDSPDTSHYNGFILIARSDATASSGHPAELDTRGTRFLVNPFFRLHLQRHSARVERALYDGMTGDLLDRHPVYRDRLPKEPVQLTDEMVALLAYAVTGHTVGACAAALDKTPTDFLRWSKPLVDAELLLPVVVSKQATDLQRFHANQYVPGSGAALIQHFVAALAESDVALIRGAGVDISRADAGQLIAQTAAVMRRRHAGRDFSLGVSALNHPLGFLAVLAGIALGASVTLLDRVDSPAPGQRLDLLLHRDDEAEDFWHSRERMALGLDGGEGTLLRLLEDEAESAPIAAELGGTISTCLNGRVLTIDAATLIEAACSLSGATTRIPFIAASLHTFGAFFSALVSIKNMQTILLQ